MITKPRTVSMRLTEDQYQTIQQMITFIEVQTGTKVTQSSLILKLIEFGKPVLEQLYPRKAPPVAAPTDLALSGAPTKRGFWRRS